MATKYRLEGFDRVKKDFITWLDSPTLAINDFLNVVESNTLSLLRQNTPKDTGELANSWHTINKTQTLLEIGVADDQEDKLRYIVGGTRFIPPNPFMDAVDNSINNLINTLLGQNLVRRHRFWEPVSRKINITSTTGLTGVKYNSRRKFGRASTVRPRTGRLRNRVRIGRRRRVGTVSKDFAKHIGIG